MYATVPDSSQHGKPSPLRVQGGSDEEREAPRSFRRSLRFPFAASSYKAEAASGGDQQRPWRIVGLLLLSFVLLGLSIRVRLGLSPLMGSAATATPPPPPPSLLSPSSPSSSSISSSWTQECKPGKFRNSDQMAYSYWRQSDGLVLPMYTTDKLDSFNGRATRAVIVQHGNLRNGNEYFCAAVNVLRGELTLNPTLNLTLALEDFIVVSPQFLVEDDYCWYPTSGLMEAIRVAPPSMCGLPLAVYSSDGWKDGHYSVSTNGSGSGSGIGAPSNPRLHSYDVFNRLIDRLSDAAYFPALRQITLFGFSAGAQTLVRYAAFPQLGAAAALPPPPGAQRRVKINFVVSDPSTYLYLDNTRPFTNGSYGFGVPDGPSWLSPRWSEWLPTWNESCANYNVWRYGFDRLEGYYDHYRAGNKAVRESILANFPLLDMTYLVATNDYQNCRLGREKNSLACNDNELATYCQAMLQGENRLDRAVKWHAYLRHLYGREVHSMRYVEGVDHDPLGCIASSVGKCVIFGLNC